VGWSRKTLFIKFVDAMSLRSIKFSASGDFREKPYLKDEIFVKVDIAEVVEHTAYVQGTGCAGLLLAGP
jgi:hypothetical protein